MTNSEKFEVIMIPIFGAVVYLVATELPKTINIGVLLLDASVLLLFQGLIRDLWLLSNQKRMTQQNPVKVARCMCVESTLGITGIIIGIIALGSGIDHLLYMNQWFWAVLVVVIMTVGFLIKDFVLEWSPFKIYRDKDHMNIVFSWKG